MTIKDTIEELKKYDFALSRSDMNIKAYDFAIRYLMILDNAKQLTMEEVLTKIKELEEK